MFWKAKLSAFCTVHSIRQESLPGVSYGDMSVVSKFLSFKSVYENPMV